MQKVFAAIYYSHAIWFQTLVVTLRWAVYLLAWIPKSYYGSRG